MQRGSAAYIHCCCDVDGVSVGQYLLAWWQRITVELQQHDHLARNLQPFPYIKQTQTKGNNITTMNGVQQCLKEETQYNTTALYNSIGSTQSGVPMLQSPKFKRSGPG